MTRSESRCVAQMVQFYGDYLMIPYKSAGQ
jgi:hypothetical protein